MDPYKELKIILNPDGTLTRYDGTPEVPPSPDPTLPIPVLSKDLPVNQSKNTGSGSSVDNTFVRIYLPREALDNNPPNSKLPLIVFIHGGGFLLYSAASANVHDFCNNLAKHTQSVVVSVNYRLAPEHRLPAAYDDSVEAIHMIKASNDTWLTKHADYSNCFLMGESAGGNIAYNVGLRVVAEVENIKPLTIKGMILTQPFFGGINRTSSELRLYEDKVLPVCVTDLMWNLSLPLGADRNHEYANPMANGGSKALDLMRLLQWKVAVVGSDGDQLVDRERELVKLLQDKGVNVVGQFYPEGCHGIFSSDPSMSVKIFDLVKSLRL